MTTTDDVASAWRDTTLPVADRVADLISRMTLQEKVAQLYGVWVGVDDSAAGVAPHQHDYATTTIEWSTLIESGLGQMTRPFGTRPVEPLAGARSLARSQNEIVAASRFGIPALVHEECLTGLAVWKATTYPAPLCWGASFNPTLVEQMGAQIGANMRKLGIHQGLAPVLDVTRDPRWGRTEETIGEDPYLVGLIGSAYVRGLESAGAVATLKHFVGYSNSRAGRNLAPVSIGPRELYDVLLPPFEMALRAGARSVMNSYTDLDGVPTAADASLLTDLLRDAYGFDGTVVADYYSVAFLEALHHVAASPGEAASLALQAGIDVELPTVNCFGAPLIDAVDSGRVDVALVDRALARVLHQKAQLGLLDADWSALPDVLAHDGIDLDDPVSRATARLLAEQSIVLLANDGTLPLQPGKRVAVIGPRAHESGAMLGCYSFTMHVGPQHPDVPIGVDIPTLLDSLTARITTEIAYAEGCPVLGGSDEEIRAAAEVARSADVCVAVLGDRAGMFGRGTSGEGCDVRDLRLPGRQEELLEALLATGTPVVLVLLVGRPYEIFRQADRLAASVVGFFPGEEGGPALAEILTGGVNPSGRLPVGFPGVGTSQPATYLSAPLGLLSEVSNLDPTPLYPFGHGLSYAPVGWEAVESTTGGDWNTGGTTDLRVTLRNPGERATTEVVQVYLHDPVAEVSRPVQKLVAATRVDIPPGQVRVVTMTLHADLTAYTGVRNRRIVDAGAVELRVGASSGDIRATLALTMTGERREVGFSRHFDPEIDIA